MTRRSPAHLSLAMGLTALASAANAELPTVGSAWMSPPPPGAPAAAAYFNVSNTSDEALIITGATSDLGSRTEVHLSEVIDDVATMREQDEIRLEPGETLAFEPGSYHVMFMGLEQAPASGESIAVVLETNQGEVPFKVPVIEGGPEKSSSHGGHDMSPGGDEGHGTEQH